VVENWVNEFIKFCPTMKVVKFIGNKEEREIFQNNLKEFEVLVTSYGNYFTN
jgi:SNF2 family DNA or RNA helicase